MSQAISRPPIFRQPLPPIRPGIGRQRGRKPLPPSAQRLKRRLSRPGHRDQAREIAPAVRLPPPARTWLGAADTCVGEAHLRQEPPMPGQDAALVVTGDRPLLAVADGAGSSPVSDLGANAAVIGIRRLTETLSRHFRGALDPAAAPPAETARALAHTLVRHANGLLGDLASQHRRPAADFRCTLLVALGGRSHWLWVRVGDGALIQERRGALRLLGASGKGEFANQTRFLGPELQPEQVQWGTVPVAETSGLAAMTDGAAERLVSADGTRISAQLGVFFQDARAGKLRRPELRAFLRDRAVWRGTTGDDRGLAVLACRADERAAPAEAGV